MSEAPKMVKTQPFRIAFVELFEKKSFEGGAPKYSAVALFPKEKLKNDPKYKKMYADLKAMVAAAVAEKWPDPKKRPDDSDLKLPFRDGDKKDYDGYAGNIYFTMSSQKVKPKIVDQNMVPIVDADGLYAGCYCTALVNAYAFSKAGNQGVAMGVLVVQKYADGEPFGFAVTDKTVEEHFAPIESVDPEFAASEEDLDEVADDLLG